MQKALNEAYATAVACFGFNAQLSNEFRLQLVDPTERSPDIRVLYQLPTPKNYRYETNGAYWDIEVVTLDENSPEKYVDDFLLRTKLSSKKSYDRKTIILCFINKKIEGGKIWGEVQKTLSECSHKNDVFLLGSPKPPPDFKYIFARVHPNLDSVNEIDLKEAIQTKYSKSGGTLFMNLPLPNQKTQRDMKPNINPFLDD
ncbi:hypothetical protein HY004_02005 [Candidatus Saccharibacteria bacterium]|nr:hypothetical protein [Candidatus Saccharibacteria bacterium]